MKLSYQHSEDFLRPEVKIEHAGCYGFSLYYMRIHDTGHFDVMLTDDFGNLVEFNGLSRLVDHVVQTHDSYH